MADPLGVQALWEEYNEDKGCWFPLPLKRKFPGFEKKLAEFKTGELKEHGGPISDDKRTGTTKRQFAKIVKALISLVVSWVSYATAKNSVVR